MKLSTGYPDEYPRFSEIGYWYTLILFKNPVLAAIDHTLIDHNACNPNAI